MPELILSHSINVYPADWNICKNIHSSYRRELEMKFEGSLHAYIFMCVLENKAKDLAHYWLLVNSFAENDKHSEHT